MHYEYRIKDKSYALTLDKSTDGYKLSLGERNVDLSVVRIDPHSFMISDGACSRLLHAATVNGKVYVHCNGSVHILEDILAEGQTAGHGGTEVIDGVQKVHAPMPGKLVKVIVAEGEKVTKGAPVCIVEAMKMENVVVAKLDGIARGISFSPGDLVDTETPILEIVAEDKL
jgi:3-methylcrotonyl-CoA carboxylase alpha subunit